LLARICRQVRERGGDIVKVLRSGAAVDADIAATMAEAHRRRRLGVAAVIGKIGLDERAADVATALMTDEICDSLVDVAGWSYDEYEEWLAETLIRLLLG
jgi:hypothetical protein